jgi:hypothetical protein
MHASHCLTGRSSHIPAIGVQLDLSTSHANRAKRAPDHASHDVRSPDSAPPMQQRLQEKEAIMATGNEIYGTRPDRRPPPVFGGPPQSESRTERTLRPEPARGGTSVEVVGGCAAIVLSILGLIGVAPATFAQLGAICIGGGLLIHGLANRRTTTHRGGLGGEAIGGAAGGLLGLLALFGVAPMILMPVSAIVLGASLLLAVPAHGVGETSSWRNAGAGGSFEGIVGVGAIVLGVLALLGIGPTVAMTLVSMLALGCGLALAGGALASRFSHSTLHPQHS